MIPGLKEMYRDVLNFGYEVNLDRRLIKQAQVTFGNKFEFVINALNGSAKAFPYNSVEEESKFKGSIFSAPQWDLCPKSTDFSPHNKRACVGFSSIIRSISLDIFRGYC